MTEIKRNIQTQLALCEFEKVIKDAENPTYKKVDRKPNYATLSAIHDSIKPELKKHGLFYSSHETMENNGYLCVRLTHSESQTYIETFVRLLNMSDMQKYVASKTYARKSGISDLLSLYAEDDDGQSISLPTNLSYPMSLRKDEKKLNSTELNTLTWELYELWSKKEGSVRANESMISKRAISMFESDFKNATDESLIKLKKWLQEGNFVDVIIPKSMSNEIIIN